MDSGTFTLVQELKCLSRVSYSSYICKHELDQPSSVLAWFFEKSIDLVDGIIQLHKANLDECSQALVRVLFETYLKYTHFSALRISTSPEDASRFVIDTIYLMRGKYALEQDRVLPGANLTEELENLKQLEERYYSDLKAIKKHGFLLESLENIALKYDKIREYQIMYRNFSRNVHANDFTEYFCKQGNTVDNYNTYVESRNNAAFDLVFKIFTVMMNDMNHYFELGISENLKKIQKKYKKL